MHFEEDTNENKVLLENTKSQRQFKNAHGLSLLLSFNQQKFLFDTGPNQNFIRNAQTLAEPLTDLSGIIISHGHSDHIGGLSYLANKSVPFFLSKKTLKPRFIKVLGRQIYVGPEKKSLTTLEAWGNKISKVTEIAENFFLIPLEKTNKSTKNLYMDQPPVLDDFSDELMAVYLQSDGMIVITGCSHHGILEMARQALATFPEKKSII
ncbi:MBL fold metallo-hydrolase [Enterococcus sp. AZ103]|uniref:MBL fold metallo-hydrolase n=1 Tax=Enterococcus sp. AZ103 TaxID=2774628 RepID=UPI003F28056C